jgi:diguanylate cyclase (GGDEF)-like protein
MAAIDVQRHTAALRALLGEEAQPPRDSLAPGYDGPAVWIGPTPGEVRTNHAAEMLCEPGGGVLAQVSAFAASVAAAQAPRVSTIALEIPGGRARRFALTGLPQEGGVLILARETTAETDNIRVLKASREMFRDVALCAGGLAFETDEKGLFRWVGPGKALGFAPETMVGRAAIDFLLPQSPDAFDPFAARDIIDDAPVWAQSLDQGPRALRVSVRPVFDGAGAWRGVRGLARDETVDLRHARRDRFVQSMLEALRLAQPPEALIQSLTEAAAEACDATVAWVFSTPPGPAYVASTAAAPCDLLRAIAGRTIADGVQFPALFTAADWTGLALSLKSQNETQGALLVALRAPGGEVTRDVQEMLRLIAPMASVALAQARLTARVQSQAAHDALTGLLNPAAWRGELAARFRAGASGAVLAVECERFKAFGDGLGRAASEELLVEIAARLRIVAGSQGLCARLDEACFAVWCETAEVTAAQALTDAVVDAFRIASRRMSLALAATPVTGVAFAKDAESAEALTQNALQALAQSKRQGRGRGSPPPCSRT